MHFFVYIYFTTFVSFSSDDFTFTFFFSNISIIYKVKTKDRADSYVNFVEINFTSWIVLMRKKKGAFLVTSSVFPVLPLRIMYSSSSSTSSSLSCNGLPNFTFLEALLRNCFSSKMKAKLVGNIYHQNF